MHARQPASGLFLWLFLTAMLAVPLGYESLSAQTPTPYPGDFQITTLTGLAQNSVHCIAQDEDGFIWFGTQTSLERFDGDPKHLAKWYVSQAGATGYIKAIKALPNGILIGTHDGKILRLSNRLSDPAEASLHILNKEGDAGNILCVDSINGNYLVVSKSGVYLLNPAGDFLSSQSWGKKRLVECAVIENDRVFVGAKDSLFVYKINGSQITTPEYKKQIHPTAFLVTGDTLWVGLKNGSIKALSVSRFSFLQVDLLCSTKPVSALLKTANKALWAGTDGDGIYVFDNPNSSEKEVIRREEGLSSNFISYLFQSRDGIIFIGTSGGGICRYYSNRVFKPLFQNGSTNNFMWSLYPINDELLLAGTRSAGPRLIQVSTGKDITPTYMGEYSKINSISVHCIEKVGDSYLMGTDSGVYRLDLVLFPKPRYIVNYVSIKGFDLSESTINKILYIQSKDLLIVGDRTGRRILYINLYSRRQDIREYSLSGGYINAIINNEDYKQLLIGTENGIDVFNIDKGALLKPKIILKGEPILTSLENPLEYFVATRTGKIYRIPKNNPEGVSLVVDNKKFNGNKNDQLPPSALYSLLKDENGFIWISSNVGLYRMDFHHYNLLDHFDDRNPVGQMEFNRGAFCTSKDRSRLYFGGPNGIIEVNTRNIGYEGSVSPFIEVTYYIEGVNHTKIQNLDEEIFLPNNFDYVDVRPLYLHYNENLNHYLSIVISGDTVTPTGISPERLLPWGLRFLNSIGVQVFISRKIISREGLSAPTSSTVRTYFAWNTGKFILCLVVSLIVLGAIYWLRKRTREKTSFISSINKISSIYGRKNLLETANEQLLKQFEFDYAIISLIDYKSKRLTTVETLVEPEITYFFKRRKNPLTDLIHDWAQKTEYPTDDNDILCQILIHDMQPVWFVGPLSDHKKLGYKNLNPQIYEQFNHWRLSRFFIPMVDRTNILGEPGDKDHSFPIGVIEVGSWRSYSRLFLDHIYLFFYKRLKKNH